MNDLDELEEVEEVLSKEYCLAALDNRACVRIYGRSKSITRYKMALIVADDLRERSKKPLDIRFDVISREEDTNNLLESLEKNQIRIVLANWDDRNDLGSGYRAVKAWRIYAVTNKVSSDLIIICDERNAAWIAWFDVSINTTSDKFVLPDHNSERIKQMWNTYNIPIH